MVWGYDETERPWHDDITDIVDDSNTIILGSSSIGFKTFIIFPEDNVHKPEPVSLTEKQELAARLHHPAGGYLETALESTS